MANIRCKQCVFKDNEGNKYPCVICSEIINYKTTTNYFKSIYDDENNTITPETKKRLTERLHTLTSFGAKAFSKFTILDENTILLTAFTVNENEDIVIFQITDRNKELKENVILVDKYLFEEFNQFYKYSKKE